MNCKIHDTSNYTVSFLNSTTGEFNYENILKASDEELVAYIKRIQKRHFYDEDYEFVVGYEAGYTGYQTCRYLKEHNFKCVILAPSTIKRSPKQKKIKNDLFDARLIAKTLFNGDYSEVCIPTEEQESLSHTLRLRDSIQQGITKTKNQITSLLAFLGFKASSNKWSDPYKSEVAEFVEQLDNPIDRFNLEELLDELEHQQERLDRIEILIEEIISEDKYYKQKVKELCSIKGISTITAINVISVAKDATRFKTADSFANYLGLAPGDHSSGNKDLKLGITKSGNPRVRSLLTLSAQTYCRGSANYKSDYFLKNQEGLSPELVEYSNRAYKRLHRKFRHLRNDLHKPHNVCVTAVARELACFCWGILTENVQ